MFRPHFSILRILLVCVAAAPLVSSELRAQTRNCSTTGRCQTSLFGGTACNPFGVALASCHGCSDGCTPAYGAPSPDGLAGDEQAGETLGGDLQLNETFAALTGSSFAVSAPNMIGDNLGGPSFPIYLDYFREGSYQNLEQRIDVGSGTGGAVVGRVKLSDNNSPLPRDRVFFDYNYFHNARLIEGGKDVNRFTPGFEKTFLGGLASFEMRVPMLATLNSDLRLDGNNSIMNAHNNEFGNMAMILKGLLWFDRTSAVSAGMAITVPTADDLRLFDVSGNEFARIQNDTVYLTPYVAFLCTPNDTFFYQGFLGVDVAANGNEVFATDFQGGMRPIGRFSDQTMLMVDLAAGAWLFRDRYAGRGLTGLATVVEVHYNQTLGAMDALESNGFAIGAVDGRSRERGFVNMTVGATAVFGERTMLTVGYGTPVSSDRMFDGELRAFLNRYF